MEAPMEGISEGEWSSLSGMYTTEEANFMAQLLGGNKMTLHGESSSFYASSSSNFFSQIPNESDPYLTQSALEGDKYLNQAEMMPDEHIHNNVQLKEEEEEENINNSFENSRKRWSRSTGNIPKLKRNVKLKKTQSLDLSTPCWSDQDDSSLCQDPSAKETATTLNPSGRTRASRGSATDPQSLYARKRRERINERLKVLQSLIPNGTKVDISTMLEEAVHYVKFLQLQIKLLSSDDLWMFAPLAYNGMDLELDRRINTLMG